MSARDSTQAQQRGQRSPSPLSPTKISRTKEKRVLGNLNNRLVSYIEKVCNLEVENGRLEQQVGRKVTNNFRGRFHLGPGPPSRRSTTTPWTTRTPTRSP
jgi:hypothetical protein